MGSNTGFNISPQTLPYARRAFNRVKGGQGNSKILFVGDSLTQGQGSTNVSLTPNSGNIYPKSYPVQLCDRFAKDGINTSWNAVIGAGLSQFSASNDSRITVGSGWTQATLPSI